MILTVNTKHLREGKLLTPTASVTKQFGT